MPTSPLEGARGLLERMDGRRGSRSLGGSPPMSGGTWLAVLILLALLGVSAAVAWWVWTEMADVAIGMHGYIALGLGVAATLALGIGLMTLVWKSHKSGHDEEVGRE
jgi:hypothetical protein